MIRKYFIVCVLLFTLLIPSHYYNQLEVGSDHLRWEAAISEASWYQWSYKISPRGFEAKITDVIYSSNVGGIPIVYTVKPNRVNQAGIYTICAAWLPYNVIRCESIEWP